MRHMLNPNACGLRDTALRNLDRRLVFLGETVEVEEVEEDAFLDGEVPDCHVFPEVNPIELR